MAYSNFTIPKINKSFDITIDATTDLYSDIPETQIRPAFMERLDDEMALGLEASTEKARSEFIIAPILSELRRMTGKNIGLLSGVEFNVDESIGLNGVCDYIIQRSNQQIYVLAPILMVVEAKNEDMRQGYAQCIVEMLAAQSFNEQEGTVREKMYGAVTIGERWKFLELEGKIVRIDSEDYYIQSIGKIMGILLFMTKA